MRPTRFTTIQRWEIAAGIAGLTLLCLLCAVLLNLNTIPQLAAAETLAPADAATYDDFPIAPPTLVFSDLPVYVKSSAAPIPPAPIIHSANGQRFRYVKTLSLLVTAYAPDPRCCYPYDGTTTASGLPVRTNGGHLVAADTALIPMHCLVIVPGYAKDAAVPVLDRGSAIKGHRLDVLLPTYEAAKAWGVRSVQVKIYEPIRNP
jgi:3D (Asp-Asp-Asp) domain-containing protein